MGAMWWSSKVLIVVTDRHQYELTWRRVKRGEILSATHYCDGYYGNGFNRAAELSSEQARAMSSSELVAWAIQLCPDGFPLDTYGRSVYQNSDDNVPGAA